MEYELIATLGPSSDGEAMWQAMLAAGVTAFRLNTSHLSVPQLHRWLGRLDTFLSTMERRPRLVLDLQGSKWRLGDFVAFELEDGQSVELVCAASADRLHVLPVPHPDFFQAAPASSGEIVLNDARVCLRIESLDSASISARVTRSGEISSRKGITFTASEYRRESLNDQDRAIVARTSHLDFVHYALSYVRDAIEMARYRACLGPSARLIAKLERKPAVQDAIGIAESADELWLCRGDLGAEMGARAMAKAVYQFSDEVRVLPRPVLLAGQVLEHMVEHPIPTRSEVCYLHDALNKGYRGLVLSDETAIGRYPVESCHVAALFRQVA